MTNNRFSEIFDPATGRAIGYVAPLAVADPLGETVAYDRRTLYSIGRYASRIAAIRALSDLAAERRCACGADLSEYVGRAEYCVDCRPTR